jgi:hypothetical protein
MDGVRESPPSPDTGDSGAALQALHELGGSGIAYQEVFGPHPDQAPAQLAGLTNRLEALAPLAGKPDSTRRLATRSVFGKRPALRQGSSSWQVSVVIP